MVKLTIKLPSFSGAARPVGESPGFKPAMPGTKEAEEYAASAEAQAQAAPFSISLKRKPVDDADDFPAPKRINTGIEADGGAVLTAPPVTRLPSVKLTFKRPEVKPQDDKKPMGKVGAHVPCAYACHASNLILIRHAARRRIVRKPKI